MRDRDLSTLSMLITQRGVIFLTDTYVTVDPTAEEIAEMTVLAAEEIRRFGIEPKAALLSHSDFGSRDSPSALKMREAAAILRSIAPDLERRRDACRHARFPRRCASGSFRIRR